MLTPEQAAALAEGFYYSDNNFNRLTSDIICLFLKWPKGKEIPEGLAATKLREAVGGPVLDYNKKAMEVCLYTGWTLAWSSTSQASQLIDRLTLNNPRFTHEVVPGFHELFVTPPAGFAHIFAASLLLEYSWSDIFYSDNYPCLGKLHLELVSRRMGWKSDLLDKGAWHHYNGTAMNREEKFKKIEEFGFQFTNQRARWAQRYH